MPGAVLAGRDPAGAIQLSAGFAFCDACPSCGAAQHLACQAPTRPGWNVPGGLARQTTLPAGQLVPGLEAEEDLPSIVALLAAAGPVYQAVVAASMCPGDTVVLWGELGPGALPWHLLLTLGLRPFRPGPGEDPELPPGSERVDPGQPATLPHARCHIIDLLPTRESLASWLPLGPRARSITLVGPRLDPLTAPLTQALAGEATLRWVRDIHPQLVWDLIALVTTRRLDVSPLRETHPLSAFAAAFDRLSERRSSRWPVMIPDPAA